MRWRVSGGTQPHEVQIRDGPGRPAVALVDGEPVEIHWGPVFGLLRVGDDEARILPRSHGMGLAVSQVLTGAPAAPGAGFDLVLFGRRVEVLPER